jgi:hypothetical protein
MATFKLAPFFLFGTVSLGVVVACGSSGNSPFDITADGGDTTSSSSGSSGSSGSTSGSIGSSSGGAGDAGLDKCASETQDGKQLPLDLLIMLDASGSMMDTVSGGGTKWAAVKTALSGFINDAKSAGIGVGFQIFPIEHAGAPTSCTTSADCTVASTSYGKCFTKICTPASTTSTAPLQACDSNADCPGGAVCAQFGQCSGIFGGSCIVGNSTFGCGIANGSCKALASATCDGTECFASDYSAVKVPIATLPGNATALTTSMNGLPNPPPNALTPTSTAITGGLAYAQQYAQANPGHVVVMVLATDGLPTRCAPQDIPGISAIAAGGVSGTPSIKTFVIGVFSQADVTAGAQANLDTIAAGGGTSKAFIVSTGSNVTTQFQAALDTIRGSALPCDYAVPVPASGTPDYSKVNVQYTSASGATVIPYKQTAGNCDPTTGGWYYDADPSTGATPKTITLCPASCTTVKAGGGGAKVEVVLGCKTIVQ